MTVGATGLFLALLLPVSASAQAPADDTADATLVLGFGLQEAGPPQAVEPASPRRRFLLRDAIAREAARAAQDVVADAPKTEAQRRRWVTRHPVILGTAIGAGSAVALTYVDPAGQQWDTPSRAWVMGAGAGGGALTGQLISMVQRGRLKYSTAPGQPDSPAVKRVVTRIGTGRGIVVAEASARKTTGTLQAIEQDHFTVMPDDQGTPIQVAYSDVRNVEAKPVGSGVKIGVAIGIAAGAIISVFLAISAAS